MPSVIACHTDRRRPGWSCGSVEILVGGVRHAALWSVLRVYGLPITIDLHPVKNRPFIDAEHVKWLAQQIEALEGVPDAVA